MSFFNKKISRRTLIKGAIGLAAVAGAAGAGGAYYVNLPKFGEKPTGRRLERVLNSPNWDGSKFENFEPIVNITTHEEGSWFKAMKEIIWPTKGVMVPDKDLPVTKTYLKDLPIDTDCVVWFGHSSFYLQLAGKRILVDPVFSPYASPLPFIVKAFPGTNIYSPDDIPDLDLLLISHDHWDHLDYATVMALKDRTDMVICPIGVDGHLIGWGFPDDKVKELDWYENVEIDDHFHVHLMPTRHFSGRFRERNQTLWGGFIIEAGKRRVYYTGDGGYGEHFKDIAKRFPGGFDLMLLENGQYDPNWHDVHLFSEEGAEVAMTVGAKSVIPVHSGKFNICKSPWKMPFERIVKAHKELVENHLSDIIAGKSVPYELLTPQIGDVVYFDVRQNFDDWWTRA